MNLSNILCNALINQNRVNKRFDGKLFDSNFFFRIQHDKLGSLNLEATFTNNDNIFFSNEGNEIENILYKLFLSHRNRNSSKLKAAIQILHEIRKVWCNRM